MTLTLTLTPEECDTLFKALAVWESERGGIVADVALVDEISLRDGFESAKAEAERIKVRRETEALSRHKAAEWLRAKLTHG